MCYRKMSACKDCTIPMSRQMAISICRTILVTKSGPRGSIFIVETNKNYESSEIELLRVLKDPQDRVILKDHLFFKIKLAGINMSLHLDVCAIMRHLGACFLIDFDGD